MLKPLLKNLLRIGCLFLITEPLTCLEAITPPYGIGTSSINLSTDLNDTELSASSITIICPQLILIPERIAAPFPSRLLLIDDTILSYFSS